MSWLTNVNERLGLPFWLDALILGFVPLSLFLFIDYVFAPFDIIDMVTGVTIPLGLFMSFFVYDMRFTSRKLAQLQSYAESMSPENRDVRLELRQSLPFVIVIWLALAGMLTVFEGVPSNFFTDHVLVLSYFLLMLASFIWAYGHSMLGVYRLGKLPLRLKSYAEDKGLGLRPFGLASLQLTSAYIVFPVGFILLSLISGSVAIGDIILLAVMLFVGLALFFLPLISIHGKLQEAKRSELAWIAPRYARIVQQLKNESSQDGRVTGTDALANELLMVRSIQQDIRQIQNWPIDVSIISRLVTLLLLPPFLGVAARILILTVLHI